MPTDVQPTLWDPPPILAGDPCASHHRGAETSVEAFAKVAPHRGATQARILELVQDRGAAGATVHELAAELQTYPSSISGRLTELRAAGQLIYALDAAGRKIKRGGAAVLVIGGQDA